MSALEMHGHMGCSTWNGIKLCCAIQGSMCLECACPQWLEPLWTISSVSHISRSLWMYFKRLHHAVYSCDSSSVIALCRHILFCTKCKIPVLWTSLKIWVESGVTPPPMSWLVDELPVATPLKSWWLNWSILELFKLTPNSLRGGFELLVFLI